MRRRDFCLTAGASLLLLPCVVTGQTRAGRRGVPPKIRWDWGPNRGLVWAVLFHPLLARPNLVVDLVRQRHGTPFGFAQPPTTTSGFVYTTSRRGGFGESLWGLGHGDRVDLTDVQLPAGAAPYTIALWMRTTVTSTAMYLWSYGTEGGQQERSLQITVANVVRHGTFGGDIDGTTTVTDGRWYHIAATLGPSTFNKLYVNGALQNSGTIPAVNTVLNGTMHLGWNPGVTVPFQSGSMDDVRLWNRALAAQEIQAVYLDSLRGYPQYLAQDAIASARGGATRGRARGRAF